MFTVGWINIQEQEQYHKICYVPNCFFLIKQTCIAIVSNGIYSQSIERSEAD